jgi:hypothetical protein
MASNGQGIFCRHIFLPRQDIINLQDLLVAAELIEYPLLLRVSDTCLHCSLHEPTYLLLLGGRQEVVQSLPLSET